MSAEHGRVDVFRTDARLHGNEGAHAATIENARLTDDPLARKTADLVRQVGHRVQRIRHHEENGVRRVLNHLADNVGHNSGVYVYEILARHPWLTRNASSDDDDI